MIGFHLFEVHCQKYVIRDEQENVLKVIVQFYVMRIIFKHLHLENNNKISLNFTIQTK